MSSLVMGSVQAYGRSLGALQLNAPLRVPPRLREASGKLFSAPMHVGPSRAFRNPEDVADVVESQPFLVSQHDGGAILGPKCVQGPVERSAECSAFDRIERGVRSRYM